LSAPPFRQGSLSKRPPKTVDPDQVADEIGIRDQLAQARDRDGDLVIPLKAYAEKVAGTDHHAALIQDTKFNPAELTPREAKQLRAKMPEMMEEMVATEQERLGKDQARQESRDKIKEAMREHLARAGEPNSFATKEATLVADMFQTLQERYGLDAVQEFERRGIEVRTERQTMDNLIDRAREGVASDDTRKLAEILNKRNIDLSTATNEEVKAALGGVETEIDGMEYSQEGELITESENFKKWFGDSRVVDESGEPLVVYHGTASDFEAFDVDEVGSTFEIDDFGFYFTSSEETADRYADAAQVKAGQKGAKGDPRTIPTYLSMQNPWVINVDTSAETGKSPIAHFEGGEGQFNRGSHAVVQYAVDSGYDGIIIRDERGIDADHEALFIVFDPSGIKHATDNRGTFDPKDPRILYQEVEGYTVDIDAIEEETGREMTVKKNADAALQEVDNSLSILMELVKCVGA
jgi:hypothetical protein